MSVPAVLIVGWADSGKTTLIEKLLPALGKMGKRVAVLKHDTHGAALDREGKDTWRYANAGACAVAIASPELSATIEYTTLDLHSMLARLQDADLILVEGFEKHACLPMIEVYRDETQALRAPQKWLRAVVTELPVPASVPVFSPGAADDIAAFIVNLAAGQAEETEHSVSVKLNGRELPMLPFIQNMVANVNQGLLKSLHGYEEGCTIEISIKN